MTFRNSVRRTWGGPPSSLSRSLSLNHVIGSSLVTRLVVSSFYKVIGCTPWKTAGPGSVLTPAESSTLPCRKSVAFSFVWSAIPTSISILLFLLFFLSYEFIMTSSQFWMLFSWSWFLLLREIQYFTCRSLFPCFSVSSCPIFGSGPYYTLQTLTTLLLNMYLHQSTFAAWLRFFE